MQLGEVMLTGIAHTCTTPKYVSPLFRLLALKSAYIYTVHFVHEDDIF